MTARLPDIHAGAGEPLLLVHGLGSFAGHWQPMLPHLTDLHEVNAPDLPGFGEAERLDEATTVPRLADALERHLDALDWVSPHVAGNSLGGLLALELGRRGRARSVTALSPAGMAQGWEDHFARGSLRLNRVLARLLRPLVGELARSRGLRRVFLSGVAARPADMDPHLAADLAAAYADSPVVEEVLDHWDAETTTASLDEVACPVTIAWGTRDRLLLPRQGPRFVRRLPKARLVKLDGLGHSPMTDDPATVAGVIVRTARAAG